MSLNEEKHYIMPRAVRKDKSTLTFLFEEKLPGSPVGFGSIMKKSDSQKIKSFIYRKI